MSISKHFMWLNVWKWSSAKHCCYIYMLPTCLRFTASVKHGARSIHLSVGMFILTI